MSIDDIVRAWKSDENVLDASMPGSPVGEELTDGDLEKIVGGMGCLVTCDEEWTCSIGCFLFGTGVA